jgi:hypothetical protein
LYYSCCSYLHVVISRVIAVWLDSVYLFL